MTLRSFSEWAAEYAAYDLPSLLAEAAALNETEQFNRLAAMFVRTVNIACDLSAMEDAIPAIRLARFMAADLRTMTATNPATRERFEAAFAATIDSVSRHSAYPERAPLIADD